MKQRQISQSIERFMYEVSPDISIDSMFEAQSSNSKSGRLVGFGVQIPTQVLELLISSLTNLLNSIQT